MLALRLSSLAEAWEPLSLEHDATPSELTLCSTAEQRRQSLDTLMQFDIAPRLERGWESC